MGVVGEGAGVGVGEWVGGVGRRVASCSCRFSPPFPRRPPHPRTPHPAGTRRKLGRRYLKSGVHPDAVEAVKRYVEGAGGTIASTAKNGMTEWIITWATKGGPSDVEEALVQLKRVSKAAHMADMRAQRGQLFHYFGCVGGFTIGPYKTQQEAADAVDGSGNGLQAALYDERPYRGFMWWAFPPADVPMEICEAASVQPAFVAAAREEAQGEAGGGGEGRVEWGVGRGRGAGGNRGGVRLCRHPPHPAPLAHHHSLALPHPHPLPSPRSVGPQVLRPPRRRCHRPLAFH